MISIDLPGVIALMFFGWLGGEAARRAFLVWWSEHRRGRFGETMREYQAYLADLRDRER